MEKFNEQYFRDIWNEQGVHRHDYCESLASRLIQQYGKVRFLDIGTGCGFLIKTLNEKGCDAWGLEISDYALTNTCAPGRVLKGSVVDIPYKDHSFDVVYSQGLWEYVEEEKIQQAWSECNRVGKLQEHNIDCIGSIIGEEGFVTARPREWWDERLKLPKILIGCPVHETKEYSMQRWIDNVKSFTYPNYDILMVDNSPTLGFLNRWKDQIPMVHIETQPEWLPTRRVNQSMEVLRKHFLEGSYERFFCLESDVIPPKDVIETMLTWGKGTDWISHAYPAREQASNNTYIQGIGCSIFTRRLLGQFGFASIDDGYYSDAGLWENVKRSTMKTLEMWFYMETQHLRE